MRVPWEAGSVPLLLGHRQLLHARVTARLLRAAWAAITSGVRARWPRPGQELVPGEG